MTAVAPATASGTGRVLKVVRMQLMNRMTFVWVPLLILGATFVMSILIWSMIPSAGPKYSGAGQALMWYLVALGVQSLTLTFPFSQAMSVTRREFFLGTAATAALSSALLAALFTAGGAVELATHGWGLNGRMFYVDWMWAAGPAGAALAVFALAMLMFSGGFWGATAYKRFGAIGLTAILSGIGLLLIGALWLIGRLDAWAVVFGGLARLGIVTVSLGVIAVVIVLAVTAFAMLRRLVP